MSLLSDGAEPLARVALAISAFRSDDAVIALLERAFAPGVPRFGAVIVVDSLGTGNIARVAQEQGWPLRYENAPRNLGSAGNLDLRLRTAAELECDWCFAVNHDGEVDAGQVSRLVEHGASRPRVGAVYPQLVYSHAAGRPDRPRRSFTTYGVIGDEPPEGTTAGDCIDVAWSSSNCALYRLDAIREGLDTWPQLWMGFEDLAIGWELKRGGWLQLLCTDVQVVDHYEFTAVRVLGREVQIASKPSWYAYYHWRNLLMVARGTHGEAMSLGRLAARAIVDVGLIVLFRDKKLERLRLLFQGLFDGLRGQSGKGPVP